MIKVHLDTDLGGDIDDLCALAMLLRWPVDVHLTGITTVGEINGKRAGYVRYALGLEGRNIIPVAAGADVSQGFYRHELGLPPEERYWPEPVAPVVAGVFAAACPRCGRHRGARPPRRRPRRSDLPRPRTGSAEFVSRDILVLRKNHHMGPAKAKTRMYARRHQGDGVILKVGVKQPPP